MIDNTINDDKTIAGGCEDMILAGRYHVLRKEGHGGNENEKECLKMV